VLAPFCDSATFETSLDVSVRKTKPGAGADKVTGNATHVLPGGATTPEGRMMPLTSDILTLAPETVETVEAAEIVDEPVATPVTGTCVLLVFGGNVAVAGTVAAAVFEELKLTTKPAGPAACDKLRVRFCVALVLTTKGPGGKLRAAPTVTVGLAGAAT